MRWLPDVPADKPEADLEAILDAQASLIWDAYRDALDRQQAAHGRQRALTLVPTRAGE